MIVFEKYMFVLTSCLLYLVAFTQADSIAMYGDIRIENSGDKWICDMIECPLETVRCFVSKSNEDQHSVLKRVNVCFGENKTILAQKNISYPINPNLRESQYINSYRNGGIITSSSGSTAANFEQAAFEKQLKQTMDNVQSNLQGTLSNINRNIQSQMYNLNNDLRDMKNRLANMFGLRF